MFSAEIDSVPMLLAFLAAAVLVPGVRWLAFQVGMVDHPNARKLHVTPMPLLGGVAIYAAAVAVTLVSLPGPALTQAGAIFGGGTLLLVVGLLDDRGLLPDQLKLLVAMPLAALLVVATGVQGLYPVKMVAPTEGWALPAVAFVASCIWIVGITASFSILDHMDGLCAGIAGIAAAFFFLLSSSAGQSLVSTLAASTTGAALGFLLWNFRPARIFMGDGGAMFLGFMLGVLGIKLHLADLPPTKAWIVPVLVLGVPILDTSLVIVSRWRRGLVPFRSPGKDHLAHRLANLGLGQRGAVLVLYLLAAVFGASALLVVRLDVGESLVLIGLMALLGMVTIFALERAPFDRQEAIDHSNDIRRTT